MRGLPIAGPLSLVNATSVFCSKPAAFSVASTRPMFSSSEAIIAA